MTLLENLCKANGQQGGTIHQFLNTQDVNYQDFVAAYNDYTRIGIEFPSTKSFNKLSKQYHININWS